MLGDGDLAIEHSGAGNFFQQLRPADEQISRIPARIECFHEQLEQLRVHHQQLEEHAAQAVGFDEADELVQGRVRISRLREPAKQEGAQVPQDLARSRRDMKTARALGEIRERFRRGFFIMKNLQAFSRPPRGTARRRNDATKNRADFRHLFLQGGVEFFR